MDREGGNEVPAIAGPKPAAAVGGKQPAVRVLPLVRPRRRLEVTALTRTIEARWPQILAFIDTGTTNARSEATNRIVKDAARIAFGSATWKTSATWCGPSAMRSAGHGELPARILGSSHCVWLTSARRTGAGLVPVFSHRRGRVGDAAWRGPNPRVCGELYPSDPLSQQTTDPLNAG